ncbi:hypothetical protein [Roseiterribacter gracilis]|uniref:Surface antigen domain-containing protein n=1 Tax=Roseiterribacter gracilis TaxID=2812848 RepID=A0A8S8XBF0_9PROT|nr:hypothetical protein TMPK1_11860 [Rhodospirillales bacterium TMPK1]
MIRRILFAVAVTAAIGAAIGVTAAPTPASARTHVSVGIGFGGPGWYGGWRPYRHYWGGPSVAIGLPLYYAPPVYYGPPPAYYAPPPAYYAPPAYGPAGPYAPQPVAQVLETVPTGTAANIAGQVTTPTRTWQNGQTWCREYTTNARIEGRQQVMVGTACRDPGGAWRIAS